MGDHCYRHLGDDRAKPRRLHRKRPCSPPRQRVHRCPDDPALAAEIDRLYGRYYYPFHNRKQETIREFTEEEARQRAYIAKKYGFTHIEYALFHRTRTFSAKEYVALLGTYSDHIAIEEGIRTAFFSEIKKAIDLHGGYLTIQDTIDLELARKP